MSPVRVLLIALSVLACAFGVSAVTKYQHSVTSPEGLQRQYFVVVPDNYASSPNLQFAALFYFHAFGEQCGSNNVWQSYLADIHGVVVMPCGLVLACNANIHESLGLDFMCSAPGQGQGAISRWNAGELCCQKPYDDGAYLMLVMNDLKTRYRIDSNKVYATGFSNGCMMTEYVMCKYANLFAGGTCSSGALMVKIERAASYSACDAMYKPRANVKFLKFHGADDTLVPYGDSLPHFTPARQDADHWASRNGCSTKSVSVDVGSSQVDMQRYPSCANGADVRFATIKNWGHNSPFNSNPSNFNGQKYVLDWFGLTGSQPTPTSGNCAATSNEGDSLTLSCADGQVLATIDFASYGTPTGDCASGFKASTCHANNSAELVAKECVGQKSCTVKGSNDVFGDPCPTIVKHLAVKATCAQVLPADVTCGVAAENSPLALGCATGSGRKITKVNFASYGMPQGSCPSFSAGSCHSAKSQAVVEAACVGKSSCSVAATNDAFGDPCSGTVKKLAASVTCA